MTNKRSLNLESIKNGRKYIQNKPIYEPLVYCTGMYICTPLLMQY